jgi:hypothetical protein
VWRFSLLPFVVWGKVMVHNRTMGKIIIAIVVIVVIVLVLRWVLSRRRV